MTVMGAYLLIRPGASATGDEVYRDRGPEDYRVVTIPDERAAATVAARLAAEGVTLLELCGGFGAAGVAGVRAAVDPATVAVGAVTFAIDSLPAAVAYGAAVERAFASA